MVVRVGSKKRKETKESEMRTILKKQNKAGFTLVELMVVAIIVAILAAVAIPLMSGNKRRAAATEAEAALGTMRSNLRAMFAETEAYNSLPGGGSISAGAAAHVIPGIRTNDLQGTYWQHANYTISAVGANSFTLQATGSTNPIVTGVTITMNEQGTITRTGL